MSSSRHMISHDVPGGRFNFRAAGIVMRDRYVLVTHSVTEQHWYLPGGRVEWGESTRDAVAREIVEELGVVGEVGELAIVLENFFSYGGHRWHELAHYYPVTLPSSFPFREDGEVCHRSRDGDADIEFKWVSVDAPRRPRFSALGPAPRASILGRLTAASRLDRRRRDGRR